MLPFATCTVPQAPPRTKTLVGGEGFPFVRLGCCPSPPREQGRVPACSEHRQVGVSGGWPAEWHHWEPLERPRRVSAETSDLGQVPPWLIPTSRETRKQGLQTAVGEKRARPFGTCCTGFLPAMVVAQKGPGSLAWMGMHPCTPILTSGPN